MDSDVSKGRITGQTISWFANNLARSNAHCLYCGLELRPPAGVSSDKEHLIGRNFVPTGTMDGQSFQFLFRACRSCNGRKAEAERHISSITLVNGPGWKTDPKALNAAQRKSAGDFHPTKRGVRIKDAHEQMEFKADFRGMSIGMGMVGPPQIHRPLLRELAISHVQGLFALVTSRNYLESSGLRLLPEDQLILHGYYTHNDWGHPHAREIGNRVRDWECLINVTSAQGYFRATMRRHDTDGWFWVLEWNKHLRVFGGIANHPMALFENLPGENWMALPGGRIRSEVSLNPSDDIIFSGHVAGS